MHVARGRLDVYFEAGPRLVSCGGDLHVLHQAEVRARWASIPGMFAPVKSSWKKLALFAVTRSVAPLTWPPAFWLKIKPLGQYRYVV